MRTYEDGHGRRTERIQVELTAIEAEAITAAADHLSELVADTFPDWPLLDGLRRVAKAFRAEGG